MSSGCSPFSKIRTSILPDAFATAIRTGRFATTSAHQSSAMTTTFRGLGSPRTNETSAGSSRTAPSLASMASRFRVMRALNSSYDLPCRNRVASMLIGRPRNASLRPAKGLGDRVSVLALVPDDMLDDLLRGPVAVVGSGLGELVIGQRADEHGEFRLHRLGLHEQQLGLRHRPAPRLEQPMEVLEMIEGVAFEFTQPATHALRPAVPLR